MSFNETRETSHNTGTVAAVQEETNASPAAAEAALAIQQEASSEGHEEAVAEPREALPPTALGDGPYPAAQAEALPRITPNESATTAPPEVQIELPGINAEAPEAAEIDSMLADMEKASGVAQGKVVHGKVLKVTESEVRVSVGTGLEGSVPLSEFLSMEGQLTAAPGDEVDFWVESYNAKEGTVMLSRQKAARLEVWEKIERAYREQSNITGQACSTALKAV